MENRKVLYNVHTHVFDRNCIPPDILGKRWGWVLKRLIAAKSDTLILRTLQFFTFFFRNWGVLERAKMLFRAFAKGGQLPVIQTLIDEYKAIDPNISFRFVILCQDMDSNGVPKPITDLRAQVDEIARIKDIYKGSAISDAIIPFLGIHPDSHADSSKLMSFVKYYIEEKKFAGIKIYPASGHFPNDPRLDPLWEYCVYKEIPIMTHATCGPIYYRGKDLAQRIGNPRVYPILNKAKEIQANFSSTANFEKLLLKYDKLKICFGHCGGHANSHKTDMDKIQHSWMNKILSFCQEYENVYCDISFINSSVKTLEYLNSTIAQLPKNGQYNVYDKLLYGTDFYVNKHKCDEKEAFQNSAAVFDINRIAGVNAVNYLK